MGFPFPDNVKTIIDIFSQHGKKAYAVGGCIRDIVMNKTPADWDITTSATPEEIIDIFNSENIRTIPTGLKHGTVSVLIDNETYECTTFRIDKGYSDNRHPDSVEFTDNVKYDLCRRDFTINAMACCPGDEILDLFGGMDDIQNKTVKCVGDASQRFEEDALRMLRAIRFATVLDFNIDKDTSFAIGEKIDGLKSVSCERKCAELRKILLSDYPDRGLNLLFEYKITEYILPGLLKTNRGISTLPKNFPLRLSATCLLCPDIDFSSLKLSNVESTQIKKYLSNTAFAEKYNDLQNISITARQVLRDYGEYAEYACLLYNCEKLKNEVTVQRKTHACVQFSDLEIDGNKLKNLGIADKNIGKVMTHLLDVVIESPDKNTFEKLKTEAKNFNCSQRW